MKQSNNPLVAAVPAAARLSIIVPVRNEAATIESTLAALQGLRQRGHEVIVVDGGSGDHSAALAAPYADRVLSSEAGRARQMNAGAAAAGQALLLFLHADTVLPAGADRLIVSALARDAADWGWFDARLDAAGLSYAVIARAMSLRARLTRVCTGDQALFVRRELFERLGGFPALPLMEDIAFSKRLRRTAPATVVKAPVTTSARRWQQRGAVTTVLFMWRLRWLYWRGAEPEALARLYYPPSQAEEASE